MKRVATVVLGLVGLLVLVVLCLVILGIPVGEGTKLLVQGAVGDKFALSQTIVRATPLLITGIGITVAWRAGAYNIGGEGQLILGAIGAATLGKVFLNMGLPSILAVTLMLVSSVFLGALWSALSAWMFLKRGVDLVISTILLNFVADKVLLFLVDGPLRRAGQTAPITDRLPTELMLWKPSRQMDLHLGTLIALAVALAIVVYLFRTRGGYMLRVVGMNPRFARANRLNPDQIKFRAMLLSGAICGLAGGVQYLGINGQLSGSFSQQYGFLAIPVALVGGLNPIGVIFSATFFGGLFAATSNLSRFSTSGSNFVYVIQALAVLGLLGFRFWSEKKPASQEAI